MKHTRRRFLLAIPIAAVTTILSCSLFNTDKEFRPRGTAFALDPGVAVSALYGSDTGYSRVGFFNVELRGRSITGGVVVETLPGGLFFIPGSDETQNLIVIKPQVINFGATETTWVIGCFCCNSGLDAPGSEDAFTIGPVTDNADLKRIVAICADRDIAWHTVLVQTAVWQVTDGSGLTQGMEDSLRAIPVDTLKLGRAPLPDVERLKQTWRGR
jgi:hypothetical protein